MRTKNETAWQRIFAQSRVNGGEYREPCGRNFIAWPTETYLQKRLRVLRASASAPINASANTEAKSERC